MIEINLIPDVKQELLNAKRIRTYVISGAVIVGIAMVGLVVLMALYLFTVQGIRGKLTDDAIESKSRELSGVADLSNMLTVQNQLTALSKCTILKISTHVYLTCSPLSTQLHQIK